MKIHIGIITYIKWSSEICMTNLYILSESSVGLSYCVSFEVLLTDICWALKYQISWPFGEVCGL